jgi:hydrogenase expression/formation protein HypC
MCIAWPMRVSELLPGRECIAGVDGVSRKVNWRLLDHVEPGDYLLVHAGFAIEKLDTQKALEQLQIMEELKKEFNNN